MELKEVLLRRKSCRAYEVRPVEEEKLNEVVTAASLAPLGLPKDGKPHLTVVTDPELLKTLGGAFGPDRDIIYGAPALIVVSCPPSRPGIPEMNAACVVEMMALTATDLGLGNIYLYGVTAALAQNGELKARLGIPEGHTPLSALAVGYSVEPIQVCKTVKTPRIEGYGALLPSGRAVPSLTLGVFRFIIGAE